MLLRLLPLLKKEQGRVPVDDKARGQGHRGLISQCNSEKEKTLKKASYVVFIAGVSLVFTGLFSSNVIAGSLKRSTAPIYIDSKPKKKNPKIIGQSTVVRDEGGVSFTLQTKGLVPGEAYTVWIIFKQKADSKEDQMIAVNATGGVAQSAKKTVFAGRVGVGRIWDARGDRSTVRFNGEFFDPMKAMVMFAITNHGKASPKMLHDQLTTRFGGNCSNQKGNKDPKARPCKTVQRSKPHKR